MSGLPAPLPLMGIILVIVLAAGVVAILVPSNSSSIGPTTGGWSFSAPNCWPACNNYNLTYAFPSPINVNSSADFILGLEVVGLQWHTQSIHAKRINMTVTGENGNEVYGTSIPIDQPLKSGQSWGPYNLTVNFRRTLLQLSPGETTTATVSTTIEFDEIASWPAYAYPKTAKMDDVKIQLYAPQTQTNASSPSPSLFSQLLTFLFLGSGIWALTGLASKISALPMPTDSGSGFRGSDGRYISAFSFICAWLSFLAPAVLWGLAQLGAPGYPLALWGMLVGWVTGNFDVSAALTIISFVGGAILHR